MSAGVELNDVWIRFGDFVAARDVNINIEQGKFFSFLGPSGCGKTTLLRAVSGFLEPSKGKILIGGSHVTWDGLQKAMEVGAAGIVVGGFDDPDLKRLLGRDLGVAITGHEDLVTALILTEGFGEMAMAHGTFDLLKAQEGRKASINMCML